MNDTKITTLLCPCCHAQGNPPIDGRGLTNLLLAKATQRPDTDYWSVWPTGSGEAARCGVIEPFNSPHTLLRCSLCGYSEIHVTGETIRIGKSGKTVEK